MMGFIVEFLKRTMEELGELYGRDVENDHILVLGWTDKTLFLLRQLITLLDGEARLRRAQEQSSSTESSGALVNGLRWLCGCGAGGWATHWLPGVLLGAPRRPTIVVLGHLKRLEMMGEARLTLPRATRKVAKVIFRQGLPHEIEDLNKVSVLSARVVIALGSSADPSVSDSMITSCVLAVQAKVETR